MPAHTADHPSQKRRRFAPSLGWASTISGTIDQHCPNLGSARSTPFGPIPNNIGPISANDFDQTCAEQLSTIGPIAGKLRLIWGQIWPVVATLGLTWSNTWADLGKQLGGPATGVGARFACRASWQPRAHRASGRARLQPRCRFSPSSLLIWLQDIVEQEIIRVIHTMASALSSDSMPSIASQEPRQLGASGWSAPGVLCSSAGYGPPFQHPADANLLSTSVVGPTGHRSCLGVRHASSFSEAFDATSTSVSHVQDLSR